MVSQMCRMELPRARLCCTVQGSESSECAGVPLRIEPWRIVLSANCRRVRYGCTRPFADGWPQEIVDGVVPAESLLYTFAGVGIAVVITLLAGLLAKRQATPAKVKPAS